MRSTALVVLGMHRSGTSAAARLCSLLGVTLGNDLLPADSANPEGYWEDRGVLKADDGLLSALDRPWHDVRPMPADWLNHQAVEAYRAALVRHLSGTFRDASLWGVKDPRLCRLIRAWPPVFEALGAEPRFLLLLRHPGAVARSLAARDSLALHNGHLLWLRHLIEAEAATRGFPRAFLLYDRLLEDWEGQAERSGQALGIAWPRDIADAREAARTFLKPELRHHAGEAENDLPLLVAELWAAALHSEQDEEALVAAADRIGPTMARADALYLPLVEQQRALREQLESALQAATGSLNDAVAGIEDRNRLIGELKRRNAESEAVIVRLERRIRSHSARPD